MGRRGKRFGAGCVELERVVRQAAGEVRCLVVLMRKRVLCMGPFWVSGFRV